MAGTIVPVNWSGDNLQSEIAAYAKTIEPDLYERVEEQIGIWDIRRRDEKALRRALMNTLYLSVSEVLVVPTDPEMHANAIFLASVWTCDAEGQLNVVDALRAMARLYPDCLESLLVTSRTILMAIEHRLPFRFTTSSYIFPERIYKLFKDHGLSGEYMVWDERGPKSTVFFSEFTSFFAARLMFQGEEEAQ